MRLDLDIQKNSVWQATHTEREIVCYAYLKMYLGMWFHGQGHKAYHLPLQSEMSVTNLYATNT